MSKETLSPSEIQSQLWGTLSGSGIEKRIEKAWNGHLPFGLTLPDIERRRQEFLELMGDFAPRVLMVSNPENSFSLVPEQIAIAGGWCALRTKDVVSLDKEGVLMDPQTGNIEKVRSVDQVADWIRKATTFDQIIESIGAMPAFESVVISERKLWTQRLVAKLSQIIDRPLSAQEQEGIESSVEQAEATRAEMTRRYLALATGRDVGFQRVVDEDIWEDLKRAQREMFERTGISIESLQKLFPDEAKIPSAAMVWAMYSEPYFDVLRQRGFIKRPIVFIVEPTLHTYADTPAGNFVVQRIYQERSPYLAPNSMNKNTGFVAFIECVTPRGLNVRKTLGAGEVPNVSNWQRLFEDGVLVPERNRTLSPQENQLFVWGVNLLPFGRTRATLLRLVELQSKFKEERVRVTSQFPGDALKKDPSLRVVAQQKVADLRNEFLNLVEAENEKIALELKSLLTALTDGLIQK